VIRNRSGNSLIITSSQRDKRVYCATGIIDSLTAVFLVDLSRVANGFRFLFYNTTLLHDEISISIQCTADSAQTHPPIHHTHCRCVQHLEYIIIFQCAPSSPHGYDFDIKILFFFTKSIYTCMWTENLLYTVFECLQTCRWYLHAYILMARVSAAYYNSKNPTGGMKIKSENRMARAPREFKSIYIDMKKTSQYYIIIL